MTELMELLGQGFERGANLHRFGQTLIYLVPLFAFLEACALVGLFVSGLLLVTVSAYLFAQHETSLAMIAALACLGALAGDHTGYWLGRWLGPELWNSRLLARYRDKRERVNRLLARSALLTICAGRLSPPLRSVTPLVAGFSGIRPLAFLACDVVACGLWTTGLVVILLGVGQL